MWKTVLMLAVFHVKISGTGWRLLPDLDTFGVRALFSVDLLETYYACPLVNKPT